MDQLLNAALYAVVVVVCGVVASRLITGTPLEWNVGMMTEVKIFALTAVLVIAVTYVMNYMTGKK